MPESSSRDRDRQLWQHQHFVRWRYLGKEKKITASDPDDMFLFFPLCPPWRAEGWRIFDRFLVVSRSIEWIQGCYIVFKSTECLALKTSFSTRTLPASLTSPWFAPMLALTICLHDALLKCLRAIWFFQNLDCLYIWKTISGRRMARRLILECNRISLAVSKVESSKPSAGIFDTNELSSCILKRRIMFAPISAFPDLWFVRSEL